MHLLTRLLAAALGCALLSACAASVPATPAAGSNIVPSREGVTRAATAGCRFASAPKPVTVALCETFAHPAGIGNRSGQLDGTLWGVSRGMGYTNFGQQQYNAVSPTTIDLCGRKVAVRPPNDVQICGGHLAEAVTDNGTVTSLAMYPKQPFDIAGRTGTIVFDVSDDSLGSHRAWPELWYTSAPVPVPFVHFSSEQSVPQDGFGVRFAAFCPARVPGCGDRFVCPERPQSMPVITVDSAVVVNDYVSDDSFTDVKPGPISVKQTDCVKASSGPGDMNHFELRVSQNEIDVYGTDAGTVAPLRKLAVIGNMKLTLTRGLIWLEDAHYNANKEEGNVPGQGTHTFTWDNVGFDGPLLPRDLAFDVLDRLQPVNGLLNLGWAVSPSDSTPLALEAKGVYNVAGAQAALLTFNYSVYGPVTIRYRLNGGAWQSQPWPFPACPVQNGFTSCGLKTIAVPVPRNDVRAGTNRIEFTSSDEAAIFNVDLVLRGAGGVVPPKG